MVPLMSVTRRRHSTCLYRIIKVGWLDCAICLATRDRGGVTVSANERFPGELETLRADNIRLQRLLKLSEAQARAADPDQGTLTGAPQSPVSMGSPPGEKIRFYFDLFRCRTGPVRRFSVAHSSRTGPVCASALLVAVRGARCRLLGRGGEHRRQRARWS
jgi:hypothetical protein